MTLFNLLSATLVAFASRSLALPSSGDHLSARNAPHAYGSGHAAGHATGHATAHHNGSTRVHDSSFTPDVILRVAYQNITIACESRLSAVVNGTIPGPEVRLTPGKTTWVRVYNDMPDQNTTMHWHGLSEKVAIFSDGTPAASQWGIAPLHFFDYEVHPEPEDAGTYFYHSHVGFQAVSQSGPLIVEDIGAPPYAYDAELQVYWSDYFNQTDDQVVTGLTSNPFVWSGETNAVLMNGVGVSNTYNGTVGTDGCDLPVLNVEPDTVYRMRFTGATALSLVQFAIVDHSNLTIIAADGQYTLPYETNLIQAGTGQRFDVIFKTKSAAELNGTTDFLMQFETKMRPTVYYGYGVLRYSGGKPSITQGPAQPPLQLTNATYDWAEYALEPLTPNDFPSAAEVTRRIYITVRQSMPGTIIWQLNGDEWNETTVFSTPVDKPYLVNIYENGPDAIPNYEQAIQNGGWDPDTYAWPAKIGEVLEIVWVNTGSLVANNGGLDFHPFHAHGRHFYDIGSGNGTYNATANEEKLKGYNPVLRDTTVLYKYELATTAGANMGWRAWRLRVTNAGVWMIHCHILQHMAMGMQSTWIFGNYSQITKIPHYAAANYLQYGGNAYGNETFAPTVAHQFGP